MKKLFLNVMIVSLTTSLPAFLQGSSADVSGVASAKAEPQRNIRSLTTTVVEALVSDLIGKGYVFGKNHVYAFSSREALKTAASNLEATNPEIAITLNYIDSILGPDEEHLNVPVVDGISRAHVFNFEYFPLPYWLSESFNGISVKDLMDHNKIPAIEVAGPAHKLLLLNKYISDLTGLDNIPGIENVTNLNLSRNRIKTINANTFVGLPDLRQLYLNNNQIVDINQGAFAGISDLVSLFLNNNQIVDINQDAFTSLPNLWELFLNNNRIVDIKQGIFAGQHRLHTLDLSGNQISAEEQTRIREDVRQTSRNATVYFEVRH